MLLTVRRIPLHDATAPIACTLAAEDRPARVALLERLRDEVLEVGRTEHGLLLRFPDRPDLAATLRTFAVDEKACCAFWGFAVDRDDAELALRWDGPPTAADLLDHLAAFFAGDADLGDVAGLL